MRKLLFLILSILLSSTLTLSAAYKGEMTRHFDLQAGYETASSITVTPIPAQSQSYIAGMPFSIEDELVTGESELGREIASWTLLSNVDFNIIVSGSGWNSNDPKMYPVDESGERKKHLNADGIESIYKGLDYYLTFRFQLGYVKDGKEYSSPVTDFEYHSADGSTTYNTLTDGYGYEDGLNSFIGTVNGSIFFRFDEQSSLRIKDEQDPLPEGDYLAYITITLEDKT